ncbi:hypothetical protein COL05_09455 [Bacillus sp. AFS059628]|nr:hypothetical protein COL05_09455 [Bacillus sp. AFS059628]
MAEIEILTGIDETKLDSKEKLNKLMESYRVEVVHNKAHLLGVTIHAHQSNEIRYLQNGKNELNSHGQLWKDKIFVLGYFKKLA